MEATKYAWIAEQLWLAKRNRAPITPFTSEKDLTLEEGYAAQRAGLELALARGSQVCGYKMGLTSRAKQRDVNVFAPIHGYLLREMEVLPGDSVETSTRIHPRVEPEVAAVMAHRLQGEHVSLREAYAAVGGLYPALEIIDSRYQSFSFKLADVVADNTSASGFMIGQRDLREEPELRLLGVSIRKNGVVAETGAPAAVLGNPMLSVVALARALAAQGKALEPGMVVLTGGLSAAVPFAAGDRLEIVWPGETLSFRAV